MPKPGQAWMVTLVAAIGLMVCFVLWGNELLGPQFPPLQLKGWAAVGGALIVLIVKFSISAARKKDFKAHEQGHDASIMAAAAAIPAAAAACITKSHLAAWLGFSGISFVALLLTAGIASAAEENANGSFWWVVWTTANLLLGAAAFLFYVFLVVMKAQTP